MISPPLGSTFHRGVAGNITFLAPKLVDAVDIVLVSRYGSAFVMAARNIATYLQEVLVIARNQPLTTSMAWTVPAAATLNGEYAIMVRRSSAPATFELSEGSLTIATIADVCAPVTCTAGGSCVNGACVCIGGRTGISCEYGPESVVKGFTRTAGRYILPSISTVPLSVSSVLECANLCVASSSCASFNFGVDWTDFKNKCILSTQTASNGKWGSCL